MLLWWEVPNLVGSFRMDTYDVEGVCPVHVGTAGTGSDILNTNHMFPNPVRPVHVSPLLSTFMRPMEYFYEMYRILIFLDTVCNRLKSLFMLVTGVQFSFVIWEQASRRMEHWCLHLFIPTSLLILISLTPIRNECITKYLLVSTYPCRVLIHW